MVSQVQRRRGPEGFSPGQENYGWPNDVTDEQKEIWRRMWEARQSPPRRLVGKDMCRGIRSALGISDEFPLMGAHFDTPMNDVQILTIKMALTPKLVSEIGRALLDAAQAKMVQD